MTRVPSAVGLLAILLIGCSSNNASGSKDLGALIDQVQSSSPEQAQTLIASRQDDVKAILADPKLKNRYLQIVMAKIRRR